MRTSQIKIKAISSTKLEINFNIQWRQTTKSTALRNNNLNHPLAFAQSWERRKKGPWNPILRACRRADVHFLPSGRLSIAIYPLSLSLSLSLYLSRRYDDTRARVSGVVMVERETVCKKSRRHARCRQVCSVQWASPTLAAHDLRTCIICKSIVSHLGRVCKKSRGYEASANSWSIVVLTI